MRATQETRRTPCASPGVWGEQGRRWDVAGPGSLTGSSLLQVPGATPTMKVGTVGSWGERGHGCPPPPSAFLCPTGSNTVETGTIAGIASALAMALVGAVSSYISYQQKKFCFSIQRKQPLGGGGIRSGGRGAQSGGQALQQNRHPSAPTNSPFCPQEGVAGESPASAPGQHKLTRYCVWASTASTALYTHLILTPK